jgi:hypothetical protein
MTNNRNRDRSRLVVDLLSEPLAFKAKECSVLKDGQEALEELVNKRMLDLRR